MEPIDGEILFLRHFEQLSRAEGALVPGIDDGPAEALRPGQKRLEDILAESSHG
jgi:hypothetical protein